MTFSVHDNKVDSIKIRKAIGYGTDEEVTRALLKYKPLPNMLPGTYALNVFFGLVGREDLGRNTSIDADHANALKDIAALNQTSASTIIGLDEIVIVGYRSY